MKKTIKVPYPYLKGKSLVTLNNYSNVHWSIKNKVKNKFKEQLNEWFVSNQAKPYKKLTLTFQLITPQRYIDATNLALVAKWAEDILEDKRWVENDVSNTIILLPTIKDKESIEPMLIIKIEY